MRWARVSHGCEKKGTFKTKEGRREREKVMRMNIAPGSLWIAYTLTNRNLVQNLLPASLQLTACPLLDDDRSAFPTPKLLFNSYRVDSGMWMQGMRTDILTLARHRKTGATHLVILDCVTDTLQWDPIHGVRRANAYYYRPRSAPRADFSLGIANRRQNFLIKAKRQQERPINEVFAVEANLACYFQNADKPYLMSFDNHTIMKPVRQLRPYELVNTFWTNVRSGTPSHVFCHDHSMSFDVHVSSFMKRE